MEFSLSGDRYKIAAVISSKYPIVPLIDICNFQKGSSITKKDVIEGKVPVIAGGQTPAYYHNTHNQDGETISISASGAYSGFMNYFNIPIFASDCFTI